MCEEESSNNWANPCGTDRFITKPNRPVVCLYDLRSCDVYLSMQNQRTFSLVILWNSQRNKHSSHHNDLDLIIIRTVNCVGYRCMRQKYLRQQIYDLWMICSTSPSAAMIVSTCLVSFSSDSLKLWVFFSAASQQSDCRSVRPSQEHNWQLL